MVSRELALERLAHELIGKDKVAPAVATAAAVWRDGRWITNVAAAGKLASGGHERAATPRTWFDLASLTKPITALAAARLARARKIDLGAALGTLLPEARGTPSEDATLELLLAHRAGLDAHRALYRSQARGELRHRSLALVEAASARRIDATGSIPAEGFAAVYSDLGYVLVGEAMSRAVGAPLDAILEDEVLRPLDAAIGSARQLRARQADFDRSVAATEFVAWRGGTIRGFVHDGNAWALSGESTSGHAGLFGTVLGVLAVGRMVVDALHQRASWFLDKDEIWRLVRARPNGTLRAGFDGKSERGSLAGDRFGPSTIGHLGFTGTSFWCDVDRQMVGVVLTNRVHLHPAKDSQIHRRAWPRAYDRIARWAEEGASPELW
jgi:CubicO group peptidase (beta-lactamase class C family)